MLKLLQNLEDKLQNKYIPITLNGRKCFALPTGEIVRLTGIKTFGAVVVEYADSGIDAERNRFEDGDLFYLNELNEEQIFKAIINEINSTSS